MTLTCMKGMARVGVLDSLGSITRSAWAIGNGLYCSSSFNLVRIPAIVRKRKKIMHVKSTHAASNLMLQRNWKIPCIHMVLLTYWLVRIFLFIFHFFLLGSSCSSRGGGGGGGYSEGFINIGQEVEPYRKMRSCDISS